MNGQRKRLALFASTALLIITLVYPIFSVVWFFLFFRFLHDLAWGISTTTNSTLVVDAIQKNRLGEGMGYYSISTTVGAIIAPSMGIFIYDAFSFDVLIWSSDAAGNSKNSRIFSRAPLILLLKIMLLKFMGKSFRLLLVKLVLHIW